MRTKGQKLDAVLVQNAVGQQAQLIGEPPPVHPDAQQIAHFGLAEGRVCADGAQRRIEVFLLRAIIERMRAAVPAAARIGTLLNTHANPDHTYGNQLVEGAQI